MCSIVHKQSESKILITMVITKREVKGSLMALKCIHLILYMYVEHFELHIVAFKIIAIKHQKLFLMKTIFWKYVKFAFEDSTLTV